VLQLREVTYVDSAASAAGFAFWEHSEPARAYLNCASVILRSERSTATNLSSVFHIYNSRTGRTHRIGQRPHLARDIPVSQHQSLVHRPFSDCWRICRVFSNVHGIRVRVRATWRMLDSSHHHKPSAVVCGPAFNPLGPLLKVFRNLESACLISDAAFGLHTSPPLTQPDLINSLQSLFAT